MDAACALVAQRGVATRAPRTTTWSRSTRRGIAPTVTWGINPGQSVPIDGHVPPPDDAARPIGRAIEEASRSWAQARSAGRGHAHRRRLHRLLHERPPHRPPRGGARPRGPARRAARAGLVVPGSQAVAAAAEREGFDRSLSRGGIRVAARRLLDVPRHESGQARRAAKSARRRPTAISRDARAARRAARC